MAASSTARRHIAVDEQETLAAGSLDYKNVQKYPLYATGIQSNEPSTQGSDLTPPDLDTSLYLDADGLPLAPTFDSFLDDDGSLQDLLAADGTLDFDENGAVADAADGLGSGPGRFGDLGPDPDADLHDKRKIMDEFSDGGEDSSKRREGDEKQAKKPGRKPMTVEPANVRRLAAALCLIDPC